MCQAQQLAWRRYLHSQASAEVSPEQGTNLDAGEDQVGGQVSLEDTGSHGETRHRQKRGKDY